jgi:hypothetical protein
MLVHHQPSAGPVTPPARARAEEAWTTDVVPRWPAHRAAQARTLTACQRVRGRAPPHAWRRGRLA